MNTKEIIEKTNKYVMNTYGRQELALTKAHGCNAWDAEGNQYIDCVAGIAVNNIGHTNKKVVEAITKQSKELIHCSNIYYIQPQAELAQKLVEISSHDKVFFSNSGAESNEGAIKLARKYTGKKNIISMKNSFHGRTLTTLAATGQTKYQKGFFVPEDFTYVKYNDSQKAHDAITDDTAAILVEPIQGESGVQVPDKNYLKELRKICNDNEILLIFDEVQTGFGRTGKMFAEELFNASPDITTCAKAIAGGLPMGAILAKDEISSAFNPGDHASTFGGSPLVSSVALATINVIEDENLVEKSATNGAYLKEKLEELMNTHEDIVEVRGYGLMIGVEIDHPCGDLVSKAQNEGLILNCAAGNVLRLVPPLIITKEEINKVVSIIDKIL